MGFVISHASCLVLFDGTLNELVTLYTFCSFDCSVNNSVN